MASCITILNSSGHRVNVLHKQDPHYLMVLERGDFALIGRPNSKYTKTNHKKIHDFYNSEDATSVFIEDREQVFADVVVDFDPDNYD